MTLIAERASVTDESGRVVDIKAAVQEAEAGDGEEADGEEASGANADEEAE
jgi:hypothetical protein